MRLGTPDSIASTLSGGRKPGVKERAAGAVEEGVRMGRDARGPRPCIHSDRRRRPAWHRPFDRLTEIAAENRRHGVHGDSNMVVADGRTGKTGKKMRICTEQRQCAVRAGIGMGP